MRSRYNENYKYLKYRKQNIKQLFNASECFGFKSETVHYAVQIYDKVLSHREDSIEHLRNSY